ncbi:MAG: CDP-2,3-bis-(O-geranylgeranyl)-sn-glycerol synthase [Thermoplasmata archaeon]
MMDLSGYLLLAAQAFWFMFPGYAVNSLAVLVGGGTPMDFGKKFIDGRRILGDGKTWRGFIGASLLGIGIGLTENLGAVYYPNPYLPPYSENWMQTFLICAVLCVGAMSGDALGSFIKRRMGYERGEKAIILDQFTFVLFSWCLLAVFFWDWFHVHFLNLPAIVVILVITPLLHRGINIVGYKMGKKKVPW